MGPVHILVLISTTVHKQWVPHCYDQKGGRPWLCPDRHDDMAALGSYPMSKSMEYECLLLYLQKYALHKENCEIQYSQNATWFEQRAILGSLV